MCQIGICVLFFTLIKSASGFTNILKKSDGKVPGSRAQNSTMILPDALKVSVIDAAKICYLPKFNMLTSIPSEENFHNM